jgi:hypothetical protein
MNPSTPQRYIITTPVTPCNNLKRLGIAQALNLDEKILQAAQQIVQGKTFKEVCVSMQINHDANGNYLMSKGKDYKRIQTAVRKLRRKSVSRHLQASKKEFTQTQTQQVDTSNIYPSTNYSIY